MIDVDLPSRNWTSGEVRWYKLLHSMKSYGFSGGGGNIHLPCHICSGSSHDSSLLLLSQRIHIDQTPRRQCAAAYIAGILVAHREAICMTYMETLGNLHLLMHAEYGIWLPSYRAFGGQMVVQLELHTVMPEQFPDD